MKANYEHLVKNIPNTPEIRELIKSLNTVMRESESRYRLQMRWRSPIEGKYGVYGTVEKENAATISVYLQKRKRPEDRVDYHNPLTYPKQKFVPRGYYP